MIFRIKEGRFHVISAVLYDKSYKFLILEVATLSFCTIFRTTCLYSIEYHIVLYEESYNSKRRATDYCFVHKKKPAGIFTDWPAFWCLFNENTPHYFAVSLTITRFICYSFIRCNLSEFNTTDTELSAIAAPATHGASKPIAAIGMPSVL